MSLNINKTTIAGRIGRDPELKTLSTGSVVCSFSVATTDKYKNNNGEWQESTEWHNCIARGKLAEAISKHFSKGNMIYVDGKNVTRSWENNGTKMYKTEVFVLSFQFVESKKSGGNSAASSDIPF